MPYIQKIDRKKLDPFIDRLIEATADIPDTGLGGAINYTITRILLDTILDSVNYTDIERAIGLLECVKLELYRRLGAPYEDQKADTNGDVFPKRKRIPTVKHAVALENINMGDAVVYDPFKDGVRRLLAEDYPKTPYSIAQENVKKGDVFDFA